MNVTMIDADNLFLTGVDFGQRGEVAGAFDCFEQAIRIMLALDNTYEEIADYMETLIGDKINIEIITEEIEWWGY